MGFKAVIFDLDGTLLDSLADIANAANSVLEKHRFSTHAIDDYRYFVGDGVKVLMTRILPEAKRNDETIQPCVKAFREAYDRTWNVQTKPYKGVPEMLDRLIARRIKLAILSNKPDDFAQKCVAEFLPRWKFNSVLGHKIGIPAKPDTTGALQIAARLDVQPGQILYLGDTAVDMKTATATGMFPVGALWGFRALEELAGSGAQAVIERPGEILNLLS